MNAKVRQFRLSLADGLAGLLIMPILCLPLWVPSFTRAAPDIRRDAPPLSARRAGAPDTLSGALLPSTASLPGTPSGTASDVAALPSSAGQPGQGVPVVTGKLYAGGERVLAEEPGVSFVIPQGWLGVIPAGQTAFLLGSQTEAGGGLVFPYARFDPARVLPLLATPQDLGEGFVVTPQGAPQREGRVTWLRYQGFGTTGAAVAVAGEYGNGVVYMFFGPADMRARYLQLLEALAGQTLFSLPRETPALLQWRQMLSGAALRRMSSYYSGGPQGAYVGGSYQETLHLCPGGEYLYSSSSQLGADAGGGEALATGYGGSAEQDAGHWELEVLGGQAILLLSPQQGGQSRHSVTFAGGATYFDGERVYRVPSDICGP